MMEIHHEQSGPDLDAGARGTASAVPDSNYRITHTYTLGGDGGWDYIIPDPPTTGSSSHCQNRVMVGDEDNGMLLGE